MKGDLIKLFHRISDSHWYWAQLLRNKDYGVVSLNSVKDVVGFDLFVSFVFMIIFFTSSQTINFTNLNRGILNQ